MKAIILTGASGSGKSLSLEFMRQTCQELSLFPKYTTRPKRPDEKEAIHYYFVSEHDFQNILSKGDLIHIKKSDYDHHLYGISKNELISFLSRYNLICFTAHSIDEAKEVKNVLDGYEISTTIIYLYTPEHKRVDHLIDSDQEEKLIERYHVDVGFKLVAFHTMFNGCDFIILNNKNYDALQSRIESIIKWITEPNINKKPKGLLNGDLVIIKKDIDKIISETSKIIGGYNNSYVPHITTSILAEYNVLRDEIKQYHSDRTHYVNYAVGLTIGLVVLISSKDITKAYQSIILVLAPFIYSILAFLYIDKSLRVLRIADYIENCLRPRLEKLLNNSILQWEKYKRETRILPRWLTISLDYMRLFIFIGPALTSIITWFLLYYTVATGIEHSLGIAASLVILIALLLNQITQETKGARKSNIIDKIEEVEDE